MSAYSDSLDGIRAARKARDDAAATLYASKMRNLAQRRRRRTDGLGYLAADTATDREIAEVAAERDAVLAQVASLGRDPRGQGDDERAVLQAQADALQKRIDAIVARRTDAGRGDPADGGQGDGRDPGKVIDAQIGALRERDAALAALVDRLHAGSTPQRLIAEWPDDLPITLLPLRLETKFQLDAPKPLLRVRVFPDDIAVVTHEKTLTPTEVDFGTTYWKALFAAATDDDRKNAWRMLTDRFGANRSAWIAFATKPTNWGDVAVESADGLTFPPFDLTKPASWTEAPHTRILPDRFVLIGIRAGTPVTTVVGRPVRDILTLGPSPMQDADNASITRNPADGRLDYGDDFAWVTDFDRAVAEGLGFRIEFASLDDARAGWDQLLVIGLKASCDADDGRLLLEDLLDNHHYSKKGLALVPQGTPTNNTDARDAGYSSRDPLAARSFVVEAGTPQFTPTTDRHAATDGQRLAEYLGIAYAPLQFIAHAGALDHAEAVAMNDALYAGTLGYYAAAMAGEALGDATQAALRAHFTQYVTGRGPLATLRVGTQPYGVLPTAPFARWTFPQRIDVFQRVQNAFPAQLHRVLAWLETAWTALVPALSHVGKAGDTSTILIDVLGLQPTSVEYFQRVGYSLDYLKNLEAFQTGGKFVWDVYRAQWDAFLATLALKDLGYVTTRPDGTAKPTPLLLQLVFQHFATQLDAGNLIDDKTLSEDDRIAPYDTARGLNYVDWLLGSTDSTTIEREDFGGAPKPTALLYRLLRHALLHETTRGINRFLAKSDIDATALLRSRKFANVSASPTVSHWEVFQAPVQALVPAEASSMPLYAYLHSSRFAGAADADVVADLAAHKAALGVLSTMPTARLERTMAEHLDTLSYRLDAWQQSLFDLRLREQRILDGALEQRRLGVLVGAYGYLENVRPALDRRSRLPEDVLPASLREGRDDLYSDGKNGGYVHTPSLNHAAAAAILRNAYLTHANAADRDTFAVNLSSERVRRAHDVVEGIRNGQSIEVLLGYQFERGLHDWTTRAIDPVIVSDLVPLLRQAFPILRTRVPPQGNATGPQETVQDFHVVNGLTLARSQAAFPWGVAFPPLDAAKTAALTAEKDNIANTLDALSDLMVSETAFQMAMGNFDRAAAVMQSLGSGEIATEIEVIDSARGRGIAFTNRVVIHFDPNAASNPWTPIPMSTRASAEPGLNAWLGSILGDPARTRCRVAAVDADGNVLHRPDATDQVGTVSLADLGLQPLDVLYLVRNRIEASGTSELETRVHSVFAIAESLADDVIVRISFADADAGGDATVLSFAELLPLADHLRELVTAARPLGARNYAVGSRNIPSLPDNPDHVDVVELRARVQDFVGLFDGIASRLPAALGDASTLATEAAADALRDVLRALANAGFPYAWPVSARGADAATLDPLVSQGTSVQQRLMATSDARTALLARADDAATTPVQRVASLVDALRLMGGDDLVVLPRFRFDDPTDIAAAWGSRDALLVHARDTLGRPAVVEEFVHGAALVRPAMHRLSMVRLLDDAFNGAADDPDPLQLPYRKDDSWLAVDFPTGTTILHDTLSFLMHAPQGFQPTGVQTGLLFDEWTESIPNAEEVTGLTFNFDNPNSAPPQAILLAVAPQETGHWQWDDLVGGVLDTFARAKRRAVEPDRLDANGVATTLLPALLAEFSTSPTHLSLDYAMAITAVAKQVDDLRVLKG